MNWTQHHVRHCTDTAWHCLALQAFHRCNLCSWLHHRQVQLLHAQMVPDWDIQSGHIHRIQRIAVGYLIAHNLFAVALITQEGLFMTTFGLLATGSSPFCQAQSDNGKIREVSSAGLGVQWGGPGAFLLSLNSAWHTLKRSTEQVWQEACSKYPQEIELKHRKEVQVASALTDVPVSNTAAMMVMMNEPLGKPAALVWLYYLMWWRIIAHLIPLNCQSFASTTNDHEKPSWGQDMPSHALPSTWTNTPWLIGHSLVSFR